MLIDIRTCVIHIAVFLERWKLTKLLLSKDFLKILLMSYKMGKFNLSDKVSWNGAFRRRQHSSTLDAGSSFHTCVLQT
jgi:hypothetical protein